MKRTVFWALVALNVVLLGGLVAPYVRDNSAMAQRASGRRPDLMMIPGQQLAGGASDVVYLIDTANRRMGAISLNNRGTALDALEPQPLDRVFDERPMEEGKEGGKKGAKR
jgi:hypothetical protein